MTEPQKRHELGDRDDGKLQLDMTPALQSIQYNSIVASDAAISSEDEGQDASQIPEEDAQTAIGVSISRQQTQLASPKTPAVVKAAAIENAGGFFGGIDGVSDTLEEEPEETEPASDFAAEEAVQLEPYQVPEPFLRQTPARHPSPWRADPKARWQTGGKGRAGLFDGIFNRQRSSSGPETLPTESWQKSFMSSFPSMPKSFSISSPFGNSQEDSPQMTSADLPASGVTSSVSQGRTKRTPSQDGQPVGKSQQQTGAFENVRKPADDIRASALSSQDPALRAKALRRSTSDTSLATMRTLSVAESLGDDSRFEDVQAQVNSRLKAIKDSWQDTSIKLPSFSSFTPDFIRDRAGSVYKRQSLAVPSSHTSIASSRDPSPRNVRPVDPMTRQPYESAKAAVSDATSGRGASHPNFSHALDQLEGDIVVLGGYRGSILRSAEPPHRQIWVPVKVGLNLRKVNLEVGFEKGDDLRATESVIPGGMLTHIGPIDIARRLFKRLRNSRNAQSGRLRVHEYGYDWRLDPNYLSDLLIKFLEGLPCNKKLTPRDRRGATVVAHSLGGLITRHAVNRRPDLFRGVVFAGVPHTCVNILGPMRNGDEVLLSDRVLTAQVNFSIRTSFALLPLDGRCFFDKNTKEEYDVDFFDAQTWVDYRLSPCVARPLPPLTTPPKPGGISGYVSSMASALPSLPGRARKPSLKSRSAADNSRTTIGGAAEPDMASSSTVDSEKTLTHGNVDDDDGETSSSPRTAVTIPKEKAFEYLTRTLASVKKFKEELVFNPAHADANVYPPVAVIYGKSTPTVYGAKVDGREGIKHADAYDELAFASGDGVVLARAAQVPQGYTTAKGGVVSSERGHVTLLSDLEAVGKCLNAIIAAGRKGVGYGT